jgi:hypothetical protein
VLADLRLNQLAEVRLEPLMSPLLIRPIRREYPATSAARIAVRRRTGGMTFRRAVGSIKSNRTAAAALGSRSPWPQMAPTPVIGGSDPAWPASTSFDYLIGAGEDRLRDGEAERLRGREVDDQLEFGRLLDR